MGAISQMTGASSSLCSELTSEESAQSGRPQTSMVPCSVSKAEAGGDNVLPLKTSCHRKRSLY